MDAGERAELDDLRRRAYARDADIASDAAAQRRLRELESRDKKRTSAAGADTAARGEEFAVSDSPFAPRARGADARDAEAASVALPAGGGRVDRAPLVTSSEVGAAGSVSGNGATRGAVLTAAHASEASGRVATGAPGQAEPSATASSVGAMAEPSPSRPRLSPAATTRWRVVVLVVAALGAVGVTAALVLWLVGALSTSDTTRVATIPAAPREEWPDEFEVMPEGAMVFEEFDGLRPILSPGADGTGSESCLYLRAEQEQGAIYGGCGTMDFPPVVAIRVADGYTPELRERFPAGTQIRFTFDGDRVIVESHAP